MATITPLGTQYRLIDRADELKDGLNIWVEKKGATALDEPTWLPALEIKGRTVRVPLGAFLELVRLAQEPKKGTRKNKKEPAAVKRRVDNRFDRMGGGRL